MSAFSAAASDEDDDIISTLRAENEQLRHALLTANDTLVKTARSGAIYAQEAECLRETVIRWASRAEQAEDLLEAIGAGGVGSPIAQHDITRSLRAAIQQACDWISEEPGKRPVSAGRMLAILNNALAAAPQPPAGEQEPVAWMCTETRVLYDTDTRQVDKHHGFKPTVPLYAHPQQPRQPLTDDVIADLMMRTWGCASIAPRHAPTFARAIERAHGIGGEA